MYKNLFIDLDDTLWDTYHNNKECLEEVYTDYKFDRFYASFEAFFATYMPNNLSLWEQYREGTIDKQTLIVERFLHILRPFGISDPSYVIALNRDFLNRTTLKTRLIPDRLRHWITLSRPATVCLSYPTDSGRYNPKNSSMRDFRPISNG